MSAPHAFLPGPALERVVHHLLAGTDAQTSLLSLLSLAGVDKYSRSVVRHLHRSHCLTLDALEGCNRKSLGRPLLPREDAFSKAAADTKQTIFLLAARFFVGHSEVFLSGQGVTDLVLLEVARKQQQGLLSVRIQNCPEVTDSGINTLVLLCPHLERLHLDHLPAVRGMFLPALVRHSTHLVAMQLTHMPHFKWPAIVVQLKHLGPARRLQSMRIMAVGLTASQAQQLFAILPNLRWLSMDGSSDCIRSAVAECRKLKEVHFSPRQEVGAIDAALQALAGAESLKVLELHHQGPMLSASQLRQAGRLPLNELRLESQVYRQSCTITHATPSHVDDRGIRALVDSICQRWRVDQDPQPFKLSLRGATAITHDAVSSLLRLPMLSELRIEGCPKIQALDKMRLIAKVKAGRELLESEEKRKAGELRRQIAEGLPGSGSSSSNSNVRIASSVRSSMLSRGPADVGVRAA
ncbi:hypothetical protein WJX73_003517 [Symbiochloris irregularis]|uniref:Uncharacterized protein n=1 Tax=Symbiochloris irregularis TaxID=706552 RepID=A0AAW1P1V0_9CHLO